MGINKESCEQSLNHQDYEYNFKYSVPNFDFIVDQYMKGYKFPSKNRQKVYDLLKTRHNAYPFFNDVRSYPTPFDMWLKVNKQNSLANFTYNYLSCVRDAFMHSEYEPLLDDDGDNYSGSVFISNSQV